MYILIHPGHDKKNNNKNKSNRIFFSGGTNGLPYTQLRRGLRSHVITSLMLPVHMTVAFFPLVSTQPRPFWSFSALGTSSRGDFFLFLGKIITSSFYLQTGEEGGKPEEERHHPWAVRANGPPSQVRHLRLHIGRHVAGELIFVCGCCFFSLFGRKRNADSKDESLPELNRSLHRLLCGFRWVFSMFFGCRRRAGVKKIKAPDKNIFFTTFTKIHI